MARFTNAAIDAFGAGYDIASPNKDKNNQTAYQRYIEKYYGPGVTSHNDPIAIARAATGAVAQGLKSGAGFLGHAAAGLLGAPMGSSQQGARAPANTGGGIGSDTGAVSGITPTNRLYGGNPGTGAGVSAYNPGSTRQGMDGVLDAISRAEGTTQNGYNEVLGYGAYGRPSKPITDMTLQEVHDFGRNTLFAGQRAQGKKEKELSSATGRYQITGDNIKTYATRWGLDMKTTKWTPQLQDRIAIDLAKNTPKGLANWEGFKYGDGKKLKQQATTALAYASTGATTSPAIQAATEQAAGQDGRRATSSRYERSPEIAQMQRDLNSRGAKLTVDGIRGPLTMAAEKQFLGSPTSVRTPSFTNPPATSPQATSANNWSSLQGSPTRTVNQRQDYVLSGSRTYTPPQQSYTSGRGDEGRGVNAPLSAQPRAVPTESISGPPMPLRPFQPAETARLPRARPDLPGQNSYTSGRGDEGRIPPVGAPGLQWSQLQGTYPTSPTSRIPQPRPPGLQWSQLQQPYPVQAPTVTAPLPRARPNYQPPEQAVPTLLERLDNLVERAERVLGGTGRVGGGSDSRSSAGSRSGGGSNYSGGNYGGQGGSRLTEGVGGAYRSR